MDSRILEKTNDILSKVEKEISAILDFDKKLMQPSNNSSMIGNIYKELTDINKNMKTINETIETGFKDLVKAVDKLK